MNPVFEASRLRLSKLTVAVICGGVSAEHDVSLASGHSIGQALEKLGHSVIRCVIDRDGLWTTDGRAGYEAAITALGTCEVAIPALHGAGGEDGSIQGFLETLGVPYVGSGVFASALALDKEATKQALTAEGIRVAAGISLRDSELSAVLQGRCSLEEKLDDAALTLPVFVKPVHGGSSYGVSKVTRYQDLRPALERAAQIEPYLLIEKEIRGREIDIPLIELPDHSVHAGPSLEIYNDPQQPFFNFASKYESAQTQFVIPALLDNDIVLRLEAAAVQVFTSLGCSGLARVDFFLCGDEFVVNEVNTFPGFSPESQYPQMWARVGLGYGNILTVLLSTALEKRRKQ